MAKKRFADGLSEVLQQSIQDGRAKTPARPNRHEPTNKSFAGDLEAMFAEALEDSVEEKIRAAKQEIGEKMSKTTTRRTKPSFGIDLLIRNTVEEGIEVLSDKKRMTFVLDASKIDKLKSIAQIEKARIRDIIDELLDEYISRFEQGLSKP